MRGSCAPQWPCNTECVSGPKAGRLFKKDKADVYRSIFVFEKLGVFKRSVQKLERMFAEVFPASLVKFRKLWPSVSKRSNKFASRKARAGQTFRAFIISATKKVAERCRIFSNDCRRTGGVQKAGRRIQELFHQKPYLSRK